MGQKVNPKAFRIGITKTWDSKWFAKRDFSSYLKQDIVIRKYLKKKLKEAGVAKIEIERSAEKINIIIHAVRPGVIIGRSGVGIEQLKEELIKKIFNKEETKTPGKINLHINILEVDKPNLNAQVVLDNIIADLEKRIPYRRVMKQAIGRVNRAGAKGVKIIVEGHEHFFNNFDKLDAFLNGLEQKQNDFMRIVRRKNISQRLRMLDI